MATVEDMQRYVIDRALPCPACRGKRVVTDSPVTLVWREPRGQVPGPIGPDSLPFACIDCGFLALWSIRVLEDLVEKGAYHP